MSVITDVEVHMFSYALSDVGRDESMSPVYEPGSTIMSTRFAVVIRTDDGLQGEYVPIWSGPLVSLGQTLNLAPRLIGVDSAHREYIYDICKRAHRKSDHIGFGPLDICLWDLAGKRAGEPIHRLLGTYRTRLPAYASTMHGDSNGGLGDPASYADFAEACFELGYRGFKLHPRGEDAQEQAACVLELGRRVGDRMDLMIDSASELRTFADALKVGYACDEAGFFWYEDPFSDSGVSQHAHRRLRERIRTPLLITEHVRGVEPKADFIVAGATDFVRVDPELDLGISGAMRIARLAEAFGLDAEMHGAGPAQRHCMAAMRNTNYYERSLVHPKLGNPSIPPVYADDYSDALEAVGPDGTVEAPSGPGLGVTYDWDYISAHTEHVHRFGSKT